MQHATQRGTKRHLQLRWDTTPRVLVVPLASLHCAATVFHVKLTRSGQYLTRLCLRVEAPEEIKVISSVSVLTAALSSATAQCQRPCCAA